MGTAAGRWVLTTTVLGTGMAFLDATVVNVALERIGTDFGAGFTGLQWTVNAYTLTLAAFILLGGSLGDHFGRRRVFVVGVAWFALASLLCGLAPNIGTLIAARALQGVGGALLTPGSLALISASFHGPDRAAAIGAWSGLSGIAGAIGPFLGGWLVEWNWRTIFLINLPLAALIVVYRAAPCPGDPGHRVRTRAGRRGHRGGRRRARRADVRPHRPRRARRRPAPARRRGARSAGSGGVRARGTALSPPAGAAHLFANPTFSAANAITLLVYGALGVVFLLLVLQLQVVAGFTPLAAGTALLPVTVIMLVFSARAGALAGRIGPRLPMTLGPLLSAAGLLLLLRVDRPPRGSRRPAGGDAVRRRADADRGAADLHRAGRRPRPLRRRRVGRQQRGRPRSWAARRGGGARAGRHQRGGLHRPVAFTAGFRTAMMISAGLLVAAAAVAFTLLRRPRRECAPDRLRIEEYPHCSVTGPQIYPRIRTAER